MRLLFFTTIFPSPLRPTHGMFNLQLAKALAQHGPVRVIAPIAFTIPGQLQEHQRTIRLDQLQICHPRFFYPPKLFRSTHHHFYRWSIRLALRETLRDFSPQAVLGYWAHPDGAAAVGVARRLHVPSAILVGGSDVLILAQTRGRRRGIVRTLCQADAVLSVSQHLRNKTVELGVDAAKVFVRPQGVDAEIFHPGDQAAARKRLSIAPQAPLLLWVGRLAHVKAVDVLLRACALLRGAQKPFELYLVGEGPLRAALQRQADVLCLGGCVQFVGAQPHDALGDWYRAADLTVLCSRSEGIPNVLRESLACGRPFVATAVGGIPEIAGDAAPLVAPDDPVALAQALQAALESPPPLTPLTPPPQITWAQSAQIVLDVLRPLVGER